MMGSRASREAGVGSWNIYSWCGLQATLMPSLSASCASPESHFSLQAPQRRLHQTCSLRWPLAWHGEEVELPCWYHVGASVRSPWSTAAWSNVCVCMRWMGGWVDGGGDGMGWLHFTLHPFALASCTSCCCCYCCVHCSCLGCTHRSCSVCSEAPAISGREGRSRGEGKEQP